MNHNERYLRSRRVVLPQGVQPAAIHVREGRVAAILEHDAVPRGAPHDDFGDLVLLPGVVDTHVHINEPGRTEWEGFETATRAAAAGGVTTLIEMPLNAIPATTTVAAFREKLAATAGKLHVDVGFWGGVVPGNTQELAPLWDAGVFGFKCFLVPSGVPEFEHVSEKSLRHAMPVLTRLGAPLLAHAEIPGPIEKALRHLRDADPCRHRTWLFSRPSSAETGAITFMIRLCREYGTRVHIVHVSAAEGIRLLRRAQQAGLCVTAETCPHYLCFSVSDVRAGATQFKCAPPIRDSRNRERLWRGLREGVLSMVVTDHSPAPPEIKQPRSGDFMRAWGGIASLELSLAAVWTEARRRKFTVTDLARWMCEAPARLAGLEKSKGKIAVGYDADFVAWRPEAAFQVDVALLHQRHKLTPYDGLLLQGKVETTILRGTTIFNGGKFPAGAAGRVLLRG